MRKNTCVLVCLCARVRARACMRACVCVCMWGRACMRACVRARARGGLRARVRRVCLRTCTNLLGGEFEDFPFFHWPPGGGRRMASTER